MPSRVWATWVPTGVGRTGRRGGRDDGRAGIELGGKGSDSRVVVDVGHGRLGETRADGRDELRRREASAAEGEEIVIRARNGGAQNGL